MPHKESKACARGRHTPLMKFSVVDVSAGAARAKAVPSRVVSGADGSGIELKLTPDPWI